MTFGCSCKILTKQILLGTGTVVPPILRPIQIFEIEAEDLDKRTVSVEGSRRSRGGRAAATDLLIDITHFVLQSDAVVIGKDPRVGREEIQRPDALVHAIR